MQFFMWLPFYMWLPFCMWLLISVEDGLCPRPRPQPRPRHLQTLVLYHCTTRDAADLILRHGFRASERIGAFGHGINFADVPAHCLHYIKAGVKNALIKVTIEIDMNAVMTNESHIVEGNQNSIPSYAYHPEGIEAFRTEPFDENGVPTTIWVINPEYSHKIEIVQVVPISK